MKKLLTILFVLPLIFSSCEKEDDTPNSNSNNNNPIGNNSNGTTGYRVDQYSDELYKTTDSGVTWNLMYDSGSDNWFTLIDFGN